MMSPKIIKNSYSELFLKAEEKKKFQPWLQLMFGFEPPTTKLHQSTCTWVHCTTELPLLDKLLQTSLDLTSFTTINWKMEMIIMCRTATKGMGTSTHNKNWSGSFGPSINVILNLSMRLWIGKYTTIELKECHMLPKCWLFATSRSQWPCLEV